MSFFLDFIKDKSRFLGLIFLWLLVGAFGGPLFYALIPISVFLLARNKSYSELLLGFFLILTLSDSRQGMFEFAGKIKDIYLLMLGVFFFLNSKEFVDRDRIYIRFLTYIGIAAFCLLFSDIILISFQKTISFVLILIVVPNYFVKSFRDEGERFLKQFIVLGTIFIIIGFLLRFVSPDFVSLKGRYNGILGNPNGLGLFCFMFVIVTGVINEYFPKLFSKTELAIVIIACLLSIYLCGSRSSLLAVGIFFLFRMFYKISPYLGFLMFVLLVYLYYFISANIDSIVIGLGLQDYFRLDTLNTGSGRLVAWEFGLKEINKSPIFGNGIGYTDYLYKKNYEYLAMLGNQGNAHNSYLTFWLDTGIFGLLAYLIALISSFIKGAANSRSAIPAMYAILFSAFFESWLTASLNPFTIQMLIVLTLLTSPIFNVKEEHEEIEEEKNETQETPDLIY